MRKAMEMSMFRRPFRLLFAPLLAACCAGCTQKQFLPGPTPNTGVPAAVNVSGTVYDSTLRALPGARVEVLDGAQAGLSAIAGPSGTFSLAGAFDDATRFRASRDGYAIDTGTLLPGCRTCGATRYVDFFLSAETQPPDVRGDYTLTFVADPACTTLPVELQTRNYAARVTDSSWSGKESMLEGSVRSSDTADVDVDGYFTVGLLGDLVALQICCDWGWLSERTSSLSHLIFDGRAEGSIAGGVSEIAMNFKGTVTYCVRKSAQGTMYDACRPAAAASLVTCTSTNHQLKLTRR